MLTRFPSTSTLKTRWPIAVQSINWTDDDPLFSTYRAYLGNIPQAQRILTYNLPLPAGVTQVNLKLYYAERFWTTTGQRVFNVDVEGKRVSTNFDLYQFAPNANDALIVPVYHVAVADGSLTITFTPSVDYAAINAIEVTADP